MTKQLQKSHIKSVSESLYEKIMLNSAHIFEFSRGGKCLTCTSVWTPMTSPKASDIEASENMGRVAFMNGRRTYGHPTYESYQRFSGSSHHASCHSLFTVN